MMTFLFEFVREFSAELANLAERIEDKLFSEPHASMMQSRLYSEKLVKLISKEEELETVYSINHAERIYRLYRKSAIDEDLYKKLEYIRKKGIKQHMRKPKLKWLIYCKFTNFFLRLVYGIWKCMYHIVSRPQNISSPFRLLKNQI
jgi:hypothetical protein